MNFQNNKNGYAMTQVMVALFVLSVLAGAIMSSTSKFSNTARRHSAMIETKALQLVLKTILAHPKSCSKALNVGKQKLELACLPNPKSVCEKTTNGGYFGFPTTTGASGETLVYDPISGAYTSGGGVAGRSSFDPCAIMTAYEQQANDSVKLYCQEQPDSKLCQDRNPASTINTCSDAAKVYEPLTIYDPHNEGGVLLAEGVSWKKMNISELRVVTAGTRGLDSSGNQLYLAQVQLSAEHASFGTGIQGSIVPVIVGIDANNVIQSCTGPLDPDYLCLTAGGTLDENGSCSAKFNAEQMCANMTRGTWDSNTGMCDIYGDVKFDDPSAWIEGSGFQSSGSCSVKCPWGPKVFKNISRCAIDEDGTVKTQSGSITCNMDSQKNGCSCSGTGTAGLNYKCVANCVTTEPPKEI